MTKIIKDKYHSNNNKSEKEVHEALRDDLNEMLKNFHKSENLERIKDLKEIGHASTNIAQLKDPLMIFKNCNGLHYIGMTTSYGQIHTIFIYPEMIEDCIKIKCNVCGTRLFLPKRFEKEYNKGNIGKIFCYKGSCELKMRRDKLPIITERGILYYDGAILTLEDFN